MFHKQCCTIYGNDMKVDVGSHIIFLYKKESELKDVLFNYTYEGVNNNDLCILIVSDPGIVESLKNEIKNRRISKEVIDKLITTLKVSDFYLEGGKFEKERTLKKLDKLIEENPAVRIRVAGQAEWADCTIFDEWHQYETEVTERYCDKNIILLCAYDLNRLDFENIIKLIQSHMLILYKDGSKWKISETVERKIYEQKIDELENVTKHSVDRELRMVELKQTIDRLKKELDEYKK